MSEKKVMDYKKQRTGPWTAKSLSIKEPQDSSNSDSDSEKTELVNRKRKHKFTPGEPDKYVQQSYNDPILEKDDYTYMEDDEDIYMEDDEDIYMEETEDIDDRLSVQDDGGLSEQDNDTDDNEFFFDIEFDDIDENGNLISMSSSHAKPSLELIPEPLLNENSSHSANYQDGSIEIHSGNSVNSEINNVTDQVHQEEQDKNQEFNVGSSSITASNNTLSSDNMPNSVDIYENTQFFDLDNQTDLEEEEPASTVEISTNSLHVSETIAMVEQVNQVVEEATSIEDNEEFSSANTSYNTYPPENTSTGSSVAVIETTDGSSDSLCSNSISIYSNSPPDSPIVNVSDSVSYENVDGLENSSQPNLSPAVLSDESKESDEIHESDEISESDEINELESSDNESMLEDATVQDDHNDRSDMEDAAHNLHTLNDHIENSDDYNMLESSDQDSQNEETTLINMHSRVLSPGDEPEALDLGNLVEDDRDFERILKGMNDRLYETELFNDKLLEKVDKDDKELESILVHMNKTIYSSDNESEYLADAEISGTTEAENPEIIDTDMQETIDTGMQETMDTEMQETADTEISEVIEEQDLIYTERLLAAMNRRIYNDNLPNPIEEEVYTDRSPNENIPDDIIIIDYELDTKQLTSIFDIKPCTIKERNTGNYSPSSPGPIQKAVEEMMQKSNAEMMASVDKQIEEIRTTTVTDNNSNISSGSFLSDFEWITDNTQVEKADDLDGYLERAECFFLACKVFEDQPCMRMWWYDAYESYEGFIYLFGKVFDKSLNAYTSCCVIVENIQREIYILPRKYQVDENGDPTGQPVMINDVKSELKRILDSNNVSNYEMETCQRKYAFGIPDVPREAEYIKLNYPYTDYRFPKDTTGLTFSHVFGTTVSPLEGFLIQKKIMGPCWLEFNNLKASQGNSWSSFETRIESPDNCWLLKSNEENLEPPPLNVLSLSIQTKFNYSTRNTEIMAISGICCKNININEQDTATSSPSKKFSIMRPISSPCSYSQRTITNPRVNYTVIQETSEELMLYTFLEKLQTFDADIIIGHEFSTIGLSILLQRLQEFGIKGWSRIGRRTSTTWPKSQSKSNDLDKTTYQEKLAMCGRLVCDTFIASQDFVSCKSYSLQDMALSELGVSRNEITSDMMVMFEQQGTLARELANYGLYDACLTISIAVNLKILPLTQQLSNLAGNLWARSMYGARSERNEYLLLHSFYNEGYICPDRPSWETKFKEPLFIDENLQLDSSGKEKSKTNSASYVGGLVLDPKTGIYDDYILLLDFNSLYPSIIQEYNVCFTTMDQDSISSMNYNAQDIPSTPNSDVAEGILPKLVSIFVNRRKEVKNLMKNPNLSKNAMSQYNIEQMALKLTANSMYGCLGSPTSRFYARQIAMYITSKGRSILQSTVDTTTQTGYDVIYGDTDSIMINTQTKMLAEAKQAGEKVKEVVNQKYKLLEIGIDGCFKRTLLLKKKKYAMLSVKEESDGVVTEIVEAKGLDLVRRDWCDLSHTVSENVLNKILFDKKSHDIHEYLSDVSKKFYNAEYNVNDFIIRKQLNKSPEEYNSEKFFPHVYVAKNMRRARKPVKVGDTIAYIMCKSDSFEDGNVKPCMPEDVINGSEQINIEWYVLKQILPPVFRLCQPLDGIDLGTLSKCFGIGENQLLEKLKSFN